MKSIILLAVLALFSAGCLQDTAEGSVGGTGDTTTDVVNSDSGADTLSGPVCTTDVDCDDDDPCTTDVCHNQPSGVYCMNVQKSWCDTCEGNGVSTCDDGHPCTDNYCALSGKCLRWGTSCLLVDDERLSCQNDGECLKEVKCPGEPVTQKQGGCGPLGCSFVLPCSNAGSCRYTSCKEVGGVLECEYAPLPDGTNCTGDGYTGQDDGICQGGTCVYLN